MVSSTIITHLSIFALVVTCVQSAPLQDAPREARQDEDESTRGPISFGEQVAQIITGAFTGNIDSIIKGSFGFIEDSTAYRVSHNTWETLKGSFIPTTRRAGTRRPTTAAPQAQAAMAEPAAVQAESSPSPPTPAPASTASATSPPAPAPEVVTSPPQPVISKAQSETTTAAATPETDDSAESSEATEVPSAATTKATPTKVALVQKNLSPDVSTTVSTVTASGQVETTTEEDEDDEDEESRSCPFCSNL